MGNPAEGNDRAPNRRVFDDGRRNFANDFVDNCGESSWLFFGMVPGSHDGERIRLHRRHSYGWVTSYHVTIEPNIDRLLAFRQ
jgi:hypothetical protein